MKATFTTKQFAETNNIEKDIAYNFVVFLEKSGKIEKSGYLPTASGRGKGETVYQGDTDEISAFLKQLKFTV